MRISDGEDRQASIAGWLFGVGTAQFVLAMVIAQLAYPGYSDIRNYISDLGNTATSPLYYVLDVSIALLGISLILGTILAWDLFPVARGRTVGLAALLVAGVGFVLVGLAPENVNLDLHTLATLLFFAGAFLAMFVLAPTFRGSGKKWGGFRGYTLATGLIMLVAFAALDALDSSSYLMSTGAGLPGLLERLATAPFLIWLIVTAWAVGWRSTSATESIDGLSEQV